MWWATPGLADFDAVSEAFSQSLLRYHQHFKIGGLKLFLDGSPQGRTAWLRVPYEGETDYRGYPTMADEEVESALRRALALGVQPLAHCNGDGAVRPVPGGGHPGGAGLSSTAGPASSHHPRPAHGN